MEIYALSVLDRELQQEKKHIGGSVYVSALKYATSITLGCFLEIIVLEESLNSHRQIRSSHAKINGFV